MRQTGHAGEIHINPATPPFKKWRGVGYKSPGSLGIGGICWDECISLEGLNLPPAFPFAASCMLHAHAALSQHRLLGEPNPRQPWLFRVLGGRSPSVRSARTHTASSGVLIIWSTYSESRLLTAIVTISSWSHCLFLKFLFFGNSMKTNINKSELIENRIHAICHRSTNCNYHWH